MFSEGFNAAALKLQHWGNSIDHGTLCFSPIGIKKDFFVLSNTFLFGLSYTGIWSVIYMCCLSSQIHFYSENHISKNISSWSYLNKELRSLLNMFKHLSSVFQSVYQMFLERGFIKEMNQNIFISQIILSNIYKPCTFLCWDSD